MRIQHDTRRRIGDKHLEASPSAGFREVFVLMEATEGLGDAEPVATIENSDYLKDFFGVSS